MNQKPSLTQSHQSVYQMLTPNRKSLKVNDLGFEGSVTVQAGDVLSDRFLLSVIPSFLDAYPKIDLRISRLPKADQRFTSDVAIVGSRTPQDFQVGRRLFTASFAAYATAECQERFKDCPENMTWLNWDDGSSTPTWPKLTPAIPNQNCRLRCASVDTLIDAARMGIGATILPTFIGEMDDSLKRLTDWPDVSTRDVWCLVQADLRKVPKVRAFVDHLYSKIGNNRV